MQNCHRSIAKHIGKSGFIFRKDLIQQGNDLPLNVRLHGNDGVPSTAQLPQLINVFGMQGRLGEVSKTDHLCDEQGVPVESVPCCNAAIAAVAISGIDTARFAFEGFLPVDKKERRQRLAETAKLPHTLIYYEAPHKLRQTLADLAEALGGTRRAALCRELTKLHEEVLRGTLGELIQLYEQTDPRGEYVIVLEGASPEAPEEMSIEQAAELARGYAEGGMKLSEACKTAAQAAGVSRKELYKLLSGE